MNKEYIDREAVEQALIKEAVFLLRAYRTRYMTVEDVVEEMVEVIQRFPAADVQEVVHCKDCKYPYPIRSSPYDYACRYWNGHSCMKNDFCSRGIRREAE